MVGFLHRHPVPLCLLLVPVLSCAFVVKPLVLLQRSPQVHTLPPSAFLFSRPIGTKLSLSYGEEDDADRDTPLQSRGDSLLLDTSRSLRRVSFFSWWSQVILTAVSSVILLFARNVLNRHKGGNPTVTFFLSGCGVLLSGASIIWTWGNGSRLSRRLTKKPTSRIQAAQMLRRAVRVGVTINLLGLLLNLLAAEQIVGSLAIKVLTNQPFSSSGQLLVAELGLQPLDVLIVQANTNSLLSHFCSLASFLFLADRVELLDPPSEP